MMTLFLITAVRTDDDVVSWYERLMTLFLITAVRTDDDVVPFNRDKNSVKNHNLLSFRKIVDTVEWATSAEQIAEYVVMFRWEILYLIVDF